MNKVMIVTDLHIRSENTLVQPNLLEEQDELMNLILSKAIELKETCDKLYIVFLGDICDRTLKDIMMSIVSVWFEKLNSIAELYAVIGNHEKTYARKNNIFWHIAYGDISIPMKYKKIGEYLKVADELIIDDTKIVMNHNGTKLDLSEAKHMDCENLVVMTHNAYTMPEIKETFKNLGQDTKEEYVEYENLLQGDVTEKLKYVFQGHIHTVFGMFRVAEKYGDNLMNFIYYNLATLGRTKSNEFKLDPKRDIPVLSIDGKNISLDNNYFKLSSIDTLDEKEIIERHEKYEESKKIKSIRKVNFSASNVIREIEDYYTYDTEASFILTNAKSTNSDVEVEEAINTMTKIEVF